MEIELPILTTRIFSKCEFTTTRMRLRSSGLSNSSGPRNKDRKSARRDFVLKCAGYLRGGATVVIIDVVTNRRANLFVALMKLLKISAKKPNWRGGELYAAAIRPIASSSKRRQVLVWPQQLHVGRPLPKLPLWLNDNFVVPLDLEASYEETCGVLRVR